jgi:hypothetical protein
VAGGSIKEEEEEQKLDGHGCRWFGIERVERVVERMGGRMERVVGRWRGCRERRGGGL